ncbi:MAG: oxalate/formate MFS antiporter, partial [Oxalobacteraceae bacterium]
IQVAFTIFILTETWLVPVEGYIVDRFGPRIVVFGGGILCALAWLMNSQADTLTTLYVAAAIGGVGAGAVYGTCVGAALKWFPDRRGLAAGLTAAGFGAGSAVTIIPIAAMIKSSGYESAFLYFGIGQGVIVVLVSLFLTSAPDQKRNALPAAKVQQSRLEYKPSEVLRKPVFWVMYIVFVAVAAGGLMATAQIGPIAKDFKVFDVPVSMMGIIMPALTFALVIDRVLNGLTRPFFGWVSDNIGRENTMFICFALEAVGIMALYHFGHNPLAFVLLTGVVFFAWGEIYSLFPATCTDTFGSKFATANAGMMYTAKGTASLLVPLSSVLAASTGSWYIVFVVGSALNAFAAVMALFVLKPMRKKFIDASESTQSEIQQGEIAQRSAIARTVA